MIDAKGMRDRHREEYVRGHRDDRGRHPRGKRATKSWRSGKSSRRITIRGKDWSRTGVEVRWLSVLTAWSGSRRHAEARVCLPSVSFSTERIPRGPERHRRDLCAPRLSVLRGRDPGAWAFPLDVRAAKIAALSADGHKWLLGPEGCGVMYIRQDVQEQVEPDGIRMDEHRAIQRLCVARHGAAAERGPLRMRDVEHHRMLRLACIDRVSA